jgi:hypothetical protein
MNDIQTAVRVGTADSPIHIDGLSAGIQSSSGLAPESDGAGGRERPVAYIWNKDFTIRRIR